MSHIHSSLSAYNSDYPFEVRFFDEVLQRLYEKETALSSLISLFSLLAIFISIVGVFGLVVFDSECRRWVYLLAFIAVGVITVCTVTFQNWRVANDNPVKAIKSE